MLNYIEGKSIIHKLNSTVKLIFLIAISVYIFTIKDYFTLNIVLIISIAMLVLSRIKLINYIKAIVNSIYFVVITFVINLLFSDVIYSFMIAYRIFIMIIFTLILTLTTKPMDIVYGITNLLYPLKIFGVNTKDMSLMVGIGISFMPILKNEYIQIKQAQMAKGYYPKIRNIKKYSLCIFVPYLTNCFKRVDEMSIALQAKGYDN
ncbi:MAG: energy-coupling factor transporter transmembrane protein EcfT [Clostridia bacterium]|nr:energy-coupling factor transporter transmembrane protein EcfT [Clostridia bacterium]